MTFSVPLAEATAALPIDEDYAAAFLSEHSMPKLDPENKTLKLLLPDVRVNRLCATVP